MNPNAGSPLLIYIRQVTPIRAFNVHRRLRSVAVLSLVAAVSVLGTGCRDQASSQAADPASQQSSYRGECKGLDAPVVVDVPDIPYVGGSDDVSRPKPGWAYDWDVHSPVMDRPNRGDDDLIIIASTYVSDTAPLSDDEIFLAARGCAGYGDWPSPDPSSDNEKGQLEGLRPDGRVFLRRPYIKEIKDSNGDYIVEGGAYRSKHVDIYVHRLDDRSAVVIYTQMPSDIVDSQPGVEYPMDNYGVTQQSVGKAQVVASS